MDPSGYLIQSLMGKERSLKFWETKVLDTAEGDSTLKPEENQVLFNFQITFPTN